ncbi:hypothetical protein CsSME_00013877 [Camellia sinensis var. sinensis]
MLALFTSPFDCFFVSSRSIQLRRKGFSSLQHSVSYISGWSYSNHKMRPMLSCNSKRGREREGHMTLC